MTKFKGTSGKCHVTSKDKIVRSEEGFTIVAPTGLILANDLEANELLISKAPEMLEMLERIVDQLSSSESLNFQSDFELIEKAKELIKEAKEL